MDSTMSALFAEPLVLACFTQNPVAMFNRIQQGCDVNRQDDQKRTPLHAAAYIGNAECCMTLLESGAEINVKNHLWVTPLHWACVNGDEDCVQVLLDHHADAGSRDKNYQTPIHIAAAHGHVNICEKLHAANATVSLPDRQGRTPLHLASYQGHSDVVEFLLLKKSEIGKKDRGGRTPLHWAAFQSQVAVVKIFTEGDYKVKDINVKDKVGCTPLHAAAASGAWQSIEILLRNGADPTATDAKGRTPLHYAASGGVRECLEVLAQGSKDINVVDNRGQTALHKAARNGAIEAIETLIAENINPEIQDKLGRTALHVACAHGDIDCVDTLIQEGKESKNMVDKKENSLIHYAVQHGHLHLLHLFNTYNMNLTVIGQNQMSPLHMAALFGHVDCVRFLADDGSSVVEHGDINAVDNNGRRAIHAAAFAGNFDSVEYLISKGADCNVLDTFKRTPLHYAAAMSNEHVCKMVNESMNDKFKRQVDEKGRAALHYAASADYDCVRFFMHEGGVATQGDQNYVTPIHMAAWYGRKRSIEWMLESIDNTSHAINAADKNSRTPLHFAACAGHADALEALVHTQDVNIDAVDDRGRTPLDAAAFNGHPECIELLIEKEADINIVDKDGRTPLMAASMMGMEEAVEMLLGDEDEVGADVKVANKDGRNALMLAAAAASGDCVKMILDHGGIDVNKSDIEGMTALHLALVAPNTASSLNLGLATIDAIEEGGAVKEILEDLVSNDADVSLRDNYGRTLAHLAAINNCEEILRRIAENFPVNAIDNLGHTPLHYACFHGHSSCVVALVDEDVEFKNDQESSFGILHCIAVGGHAECLEVLLEETEEENPLDLNVVDDDGLTPLHWAAKCGHLKIVDILCSSEDERRVNIEAQDKFCNTPLKLAINNHKHAVCASLVSQGANFDITDKNGLQFLHAIYGPEAPPSGCEVLEAVLARLDEMEKDAVNYITVEDSEGRNILHLAASKHDLATLKLVLSRIQGKEMQGPIIDKKDKAGYTPIHHLIPKEEGRQCLDVILDHMAN